MTKKDDFGKWLYNGSHLHTYIAWEDSDGKLGFDRLPKGTTMDENMFQLRRIYCKHPSNAQFQRLLGFVTDCNQNPHHLCLLSYRMPSGFIPSVTPHGNCKSKKPFYPTLPDIQSQCKFNGPKSTLSLVSKNMGGVTGAKSPYDLPRNERQISYIKKQSSGMQSTSNPPDEILAVMLSAKDEDDKGKFVQEVKVSPEPAIVVARMQQLDDLVRFCTPADFFSILTVDPTFNLGEFDVTPTTYRYELLQSVRTGKSPVFIGPTMIHYRKTFHTYVFFAATLVGLRPELQGLRAFGTDGEKSLVDAFSHGFSYAIRLTCFNHCKQNVKRKLQEMNYPETAIKEILDDLFDVRQSDTFCEGLVDSVSEQDFGDKLMHLDKRWKQLQEMHHIENSIYE